MVFSREEGKGEMSTYVWAITSEHIIWSLQKVNHFSGSNELLIFRPNKLIGIGNTIISEHNFAILFLNVWTIVLSRFPIRSTVPVMYVLLVHIIKVEIRHPLFSTPIHHHKTLYVISGRRIVHDGVHKFQKWPSLMLRTVWKNLCYPNIAFNSATVT